MCLAQQVERLAGEYEIHLYSMRVEDVDLSRIQWHRLPGLPGPHLVRYIWWFVVNSIVRWWDRKYRGLTPDLTYSPGINCIDADVISVHIVFAEFYRQVEKKLRFLNNPVTSWPLLIHRRTYYALIRTLERRVYTRPDVPLIVVSQKVAADLDRFYGRKENLHLVYHGCDVNRFEPRRRRELREGARHELGLHQDEFAILLIGNDWKKKGLTCLLEAIARIAKRGLRILVVGKDDAAPYRAILERRGLADNVRFLPPRGNVEFYYAAADLYVGPSLEDAFALPPLEAMACGLPVIVSRQAGVSEIIHHEEDGLILEDPEDARTLAEWIGKLLDEPDFRCGLGANAARTAQKFTWENNANEMRALFEQVRADKVERRAQRHKGARSKK
jgi:glycosyltransferase involved in cell wall biosynthesis